ECSIATASGEGAAMAFLHLPRLVVVADLEPLAVLLELVLLRLAGAAGRVAGPSSPLRARLQPSLMRGRGGGRVGVRALELVPHGVPPCACAWVKTRLMQGAYRACDGAPLRHRLQGRMPSRCMTSASASSQSRCS